MTIYLRANTESELLDALRAANLTTLDEDGVEQVITASHTHFIDVIGTITRVIEPGTEDSDAVTETLEGYHANWVGPVPPSLEPYVIDTPRKPARVIAS